jgi:triosephosphate isomerase
MSTKKPLIVGNWKLHPSSQAEAVALVSMVVKQQKKQSEALVAVAPSFIHITEVGKKLLKSPVALAAQDISTEPLGPFTGEVSALQLKDAGVTYVIIGHSERRAKGETDILVQKKVIESLKNKLTPVVCVGEKSRDTQGAFFGFVESQIKALAAVLDKTSIKNVVIAYEPIWAIGTGKTATKEDVKEMQLFIFSTLVKLFDRPTASKITLLYGGSVKADNAKELHSNGGMNGFLVGGASLKAEEFNKIIAATLTS